jgi:hypothetical protein
MMALLNLTYGLRQLHTVGVTGVDENWTWHVYAASRQHDSSNTGLLTGVSHS